MKPTHTSDPRRGQPRAGMGLLVSSEPGGGRRVALTLEESDMVKCNWRFAPRVARARARRVR
jgi:hypothetical protein